MNDEQYDRFLNAWSRNKAVLGKAVHPKALVRLHELFPFARVAVQHVATPVELPYGSHKMDASNYYAKPEHETTVFIKLYGEEDDPGNRNIVFASATCHPLDRYERRKGITVAFTRAFDLARKRHDPVAWQAAKDKNESKAERRKREESR